MTNGDKIRYMTEEELAAFLSENFTCFKCYLQDEYKQTFTDCERTLLRWLRKEAEE